jgi:hypothetical protein
MARDASQQFTRIALIRINESGSESGFDRGLAGLSLLWEAALQTVSRAICSAEHWLTTRYNLPFLGSRKT